MGGVLAHLIPSVMRKILRVFDNVVSSVSLVLIPTNELRLSKPTIIVSRGGVPTGTTLSIIFNSTGMLHHLKLFENTISVVKLVSDFVFSL